MKSKRPRTLPVKYAEDYTAVLDGRCGIAREIRGRLQALMRDLGGEEQLSYQQASLCQRVIWMEIYLENEELRVATGGGLDGALHSQLLAGLVGCYRLLGIRRVAREAKLADYLRKGEPTTTTNG